MKTRRLTVTLITLITLIQLSCAQMSLTGKVINEHSQGVEGAIVTIQGKDKEALTDAQGKFQLALGKLSAEKKVVQVYNHAYKPHSINTTLEQGDLGEIQIQGVDYEANETLMEINKRFKKFKVHVVYWPDELQINLGKLKEHAYMGFPENKPSGKLPLLLALHGAGGRKKSLEQQLLRSSNVKGLALAELAGKDLILLEPNSSESWDPNTLDTMLDYILSTYKDIDKNRVYVVGHSMGGSGTWRWILQSADRFAAAAPCGSGAVTSTDGIENLINLPIWGMVGGDDGGNVTAIQTMVDNLRAAGNANVKHTAFPDADHAGGNAGVFSSVELVEWMLTFSLSE